MNGEDLEKMPIKALEELVKTLHKKKTGMDIEEAQNTANRISRRISDALGLYGMGEAPLLIHLLKDYIEEIEREVPGAGEAAEIYNLILKRKTKVERIRPERYVIWPEKGDET